MKNSFVKSSDVSITDFMELCNTQTQKSDYPLAADVVKGVVIYDGDKMRSHCKDAQKVLDYKNEFAHVLSEGPGVFAISGMFNNLDTVDELTDVFLRIHDKKDPDAAGDHFSSKGKNIRIWNALQKAAVNAPEAFIDYYKNPLLDIVCQSWLGIQYQTTSQVNGVKPGGKAQHVHRDYHLGFQSNETCEKFPTHAQITSQYLTLQGAVAHSDMPVESGPTKLLPHSQKYDLGYLAWRQQDFIDYFEQNHVQVALKKGDGIFFNPALLHAAGTNVTKDHLRLANLLQISVAYGKTMETLNYDAMIKSVYPHLTDMYKNGAINETEVACVSGTIADGYAFPTNLEKDIPEGEVSPKTMQEIVYEDAINNEDLATLMKKVAVKNGYRIDE